MLTIDNYNVLLDSIRDCFELENNYFDTLKDVRLVRNNKQTNDIQYNSKDGQILKLLETYETKLKSIPRGEVIPLALDNKYWSILRPPYKYDPFTDYDLQVKSKNDVVPWITNYMLDSFLQTQEDEKVKKARYKDEKERQTAINQKKETENKEKQEKDNFTREKRGEILIGILDDNDISAYLVDSTLAKDFAKQVHETWKTQLAYFPLDSRPVVPIHIINNTLYDKALFDATKGHYIYNSLSHDYLYQAIYDKFNPFLDYNEKVDRMRFPWLPKEDFDELRKREALKDNITSILQDKKTDVRESLPIEVLYYYTIQKKYDNGKGFRNDYKQTVIVNPYESELNNIPYGERIPALLNNRAWFGYVRDYITDYDFSWGSEEKTKKKYLPWLDNVSGQTLLKFRNILFENLNSNNKKLQKELDNITSMEKQIDLLLSVYDITDQVRKKI